MRYFGGKSRTYKEIAKVINGYKKQGQVFLSPFVGGGWVEQLIEGKKILSDIHYYLIEMYKELQNGWIPPSNLTKEEYEYIKNNKEEKPYLTGFVGFGCSHSGRWFEGYAKDSKNYNYCLGAKNSLEKKASNGLLKAEFYNKDYREFAPTDMIIYCDPPYKTSTKNYNCGEFDTDEFWEIMRIWSKDNIVIISEYEAPNDFVEIWRKEIKTQLKSSQGEKYTRVEKLFIHKDNK